MTVCIATICDQKSFPGFIVIACDSKVGSALGSAETMLKAPTVHAGWRLLVSGTTSKIESLVRCFKKTFAGSTIIDHTNLDGLIKAALALRRTELADEFCRTEFAISYDEFLTHGKERLPADIFYEAVQKVRRQRLEAQAILCGFSNGCPEIYEIGDDAIAHAANIFATIGEGEYLASSVLLRRQQNNITDLHTSLYNVWEAKKYAEAVGSVGKSTLFAIISRDHGMRVCSGALMARLNELYGKFGPKDVSDKIEIAGPLYYDEERLLIPPQ